MLFGVKSFVDFCLGIGGALPIGYELCSSGFGITDKGSCAAWCTPLGDEIWHKQEPVGLSERSFLCAAELDEICYKSCMSVRACARKQLF